ncbi:MAG: RNase adapter RapZ [Actinobacteria bacterium HGW-Actinobacteria-4]|nr:MAG: RNase adapter RapZ [Actinobacteria bacterium HGW-Actinobacteria-4]
MTDDADPQTYPSGIPKPVFDVPPDAPEVMIVTGMSGAGRTRAAAVLADLGWYVVDNLPPQMLTELVSMVGRNAKRRLAAVVDVRGGEFFQDLGAVIDDIAAGGVGVSMLYLDADDSVLVSRFEEARRPHPLQGNGTILEGIARERLQMKAVRDRADHVVDTSGLNLHQLRDRLVATVARDSDGEAVLHVNVQSFGFKHGVPSDADFVADVRFLDNPHWIPELRPLTGLDQAVSEHVLASEGAPEFLEGYVNVLATALQRYRVHDKHSVTIAIGCTGGRHRSVAMSEAIGKNLAERGYSVRVTHRDRTPA